MQEDQKVQSEASAAVKERMCAKCQGKMVQRKSKYGTFFGCANYPKCTYKEKN